MKIIISLVCSITSNLSKQTPSLIMSKVLNIRAYSDLDHRVVEGNSETLHLHGEHNSHSLVVPDVVQGSDGTKNKNTKKVVRAWKTSSSRATDMSARLAKSSRINAQLRVQPLVKRTAGLLSGLSRTNNKSISSWDGAEVGRYGMAQTKSHQRSNGSRTISSDSGSDDDDEDEERSSDSSEQASTRESSSTEDEAVESDADGTHQVEGDTFEQQNVFNERVVIYFRPKAGVSSEKSSVLKEVFRANHPNALVLLETVTENSRSTYASRTILNRLMNDVFDQRVKEILVADFNHICSTKDGFQLFCWICNCFGTQVLISPALQLV
ncbi:MAG: hypothetical protein P4M14_11590 [Gammaproteobacteria bacterium]|nr:hypothetical protein [Gammaproteobacteria bacterium]